MQRLALCGAAAPALGADLGARPIQAPPAYAAPIYNWTGFYVGGHVGGAFSSDNNFNGLLTATTAVSSAACRSVPTGSSTRTGWSASKASTPGSAAASARSFPGGVAYTNDQRGLGSITGRVGYTWGPGLLYVKGGYAYSDNNETVTLGGVPIGFIINGDHRNGYTVGAGLEYMFAPNWSAKAEYQYYNFGDAHFTRRPARGPGNFTTDDHTFKAGVNYRFNWGSPVVARY